MGDEYPEHLNPFKERRTGLRASFRALKNTIGGRFRKKKEETNETNAKKNSGVTNYPTTLRNGTVNGTTRSQTTSELFLRSRFNDRVARSQTLHFNRVENQNGNEKSNPFNETDTIPASNESDNGFIPGKIDTNGGTNTTTRRRRRKKRAPLPPGTINRLRVPGDNNNSEWSLDSYTSYETDYSSTAYTQSENELDAPTDDDRLKDIQEISKEIQVYCDETKGEVQIETEENKVQGQDTNIPEENKNEISPPEIQISVHEDEQNHLNINKENVDNDKSKITTDDVEKSEITTDSEEKVVITTECQEIDKNNCDINAIKIEKSEESTSVVLNTTNEQETKEENEIKQEVNEIKLKETDEVTNVEQTDNINNEPNENVTNENGIEETKVIKEKNENGDKLHIMNGTDANQDALEKEIVICDKQNGDLSATTAKDKSNGTSEKDNFEYVNRKSLYIAGSTDNLDDVQHSETTLFITGSCDDLDAPDNETPRPKVRKSKLGREILLGSNDKVNK